MIDRKSASRRTVHGVERRRRRVESRKDVDVRTFDQKFADALVDPLNVAVGIVGTTLFVAFAMPALIHLVLLLIPLVVWLHVQNREVRLPFRMPIGANRLDLGDPKAGYSGFNKARGMILLGYDYEADNAQIWAARTDMLGHLLILGKTGAGKTEGILSLFANFLSIGAGGIGVDAKGDPKAIFQMHEMCRRFGVVEDFQVLDFMTGGKNMNCRQRARMSNTCNPFATASADASFQIMSSMIKAGEGGSNNVFADRALSLMTAALSAAAELRDLGIMSLGPGTIRDILPLDKLESLANNPLLSQKTRNQIERGYFNMLPGYKKVYDEAESKQKAEMTTQHGYGVSYFARSLSSFSSTYGHIFDVTMGEVDFTDVCMNKRMLWIALPPLEKSPAEMKIIGQINLALLKEVFARAMGTRIEGTYTEVIENRPSASNVPFLIVLDEYAYIATEGVGVIPAQARGLGFSVVFSGQDWGGFEAGDKTAAQQIWGSTTMKFIGVVEDPETISRVITKMGKAKVVEASGFEIDGSPTSKFSGVGYQAQELIEAVDLQGQNEGMAHMTAFGSLYRMKMFFAGPTGKTDFQINRFIAVGDRERRYHIAKNKDAEGFFQKTLNILIVSGVILDDGLPGGKLNWHEGG